MQATVRRLLDLGLAALVFAGCAKDHPPAAAEPTPAPAPAPRSKAMTMETAPPRAPSDDGISGTVLETMDSGGYTYAKLDHGGTQVWAAGPQTKLAVGTVVGNVSGTVMTGFRSETLKRTFDQIYFVTSFPVSGGAAAAVDPHAAAPAPGKAEPIEKIERAAGGKTVAEAFASKDALVGKPIVIRGKVVKLNNGIMGRNWIHLRDGSGAAGTNDLLVTTTDTAALGDVVVARGTLATNKDFGGGYKYDVLVENATIAAK
jgi:hypothetical protein